MAVGIGRGGAVRFSTRVGGLRRLDRMIGTMRRRGEDLAPWFREELDPAVRDMMRAAWDTQGRAIGERWRPLRPATRAWRRRQEQFGGNVGGVDHPLWNTGRLRDAWVTNTPDTILTVNARRYERRTSVAYDVFHQLGFVVRRWGNVVFRRPRRVPSRRIVPDEVPRPIVARWETSLVAWLTANVTSEAPFRVFGVDAPSSS